MPMWSLMIVASLAGDPVALTPDPQKCVRSAARALLHAKSYAVTWRYRIGPSGDASHTVDPTWFLQMYEGTVDRGLAHFPAVDIYRRGSKGAVKGARGWQSLFSHRVGKWLGTLFVYPETLVTQLVKGGRKFHWVAGSENTVVRLELSPALAREHYTHMVQSGCMKSNSEAVSPIFDKVDNTRVMAIVDVHLDPKRECLTRIVVRVIAGLTTQESRARPLGTGEHMVLFAEHVLSKQGDVDALSIPAEARSFFR